MTLANSAAIDPGSVISAETGRLLPTFSPSFLVSSSLSMRRPASTTVNPAFISASDAARPTPVPAPVTRAILFRVWVICFPAFMFLVLSHAYRVVLEYSDAPRAAPPTSVSADRENTVRRLRCGDEDRRRKR